VAHLTAEKEWVLLALQSLLPIQATGTRLDLGLEVAYDQVIGQWHRVAHRQAIILLTDGRHTGPGGNDEVRAVANRIKASGIPLVTVGLGTDVDTALLQEIATNPHYYHAALTVEDLGRIRREMAGPIPCP
jgi:Mg-chelatase subunit ChlD